MVERNALAGRRVLVVEDEALVAMLIEDILADAGAEVVGPAGRLPLALDLAGREAIDAALLDVNLGGDTTAAVAEVLAGREIPFAFATGYGAGGLPPGFERSPMLPKPFQERELLDAVRRLLGA